MRKTKEEAEQTRQNILKACVAIVNEKGYERMTRDDIAEKLHMTRGAVNWHFKTKEDIYLAALEMVLEQLDSQRERYFSTQASSVRERLTGLFLLPVREEELFDFVNSIPKLLQSDERFARIQQRKFSNRRNFLAYTEKCLEQLEREEKIELKKPKTELAQLLYLLFEGLHTQHSNDSFLSAITEEKIKVYLDMILS